MDKIKIAVIGLGNIGKAACESVLDSPDMELAGIVRRQPDTQSFNGIRIVGDAAELGGIDVAILACPSRSAAELAEKYLEMGINTVDSFDIHSDIYEHKMRLDAAAKKSGAVSVVAAGWDPGSDSIIRTLMLAMTPKGITHTNFGPGMSMGHTVAVKAIEGVRAALSVTIPAGSGNHDRMVYVEAEAGADLKKTEELIKTDPYFINDRTRVVFVDDVGEYKDMGHGVHMIRKGASGSAHNQLLEFKMAINNPSLTAQIMISCARASVKQKSGCYTMIELPVIDFLHGETEQLIRRLV